jgi:hypothetical protein
MDEFRDEAPKGKSLERRLADSFAEHIERDVNQMVSLFQQMLLETDKKRLDLVCREFKQMQPANLARAWRMVRKYKVERAMRDPSYSMQEEADRLKRAIEAMQVSPRIGAELADKIVDHATSSPTVSVYVESRTAGDRPVRKQRVVRAKLIADVRRQDNTKFWKMGEVVWVRVHEVEGQDTEWCDIIDGSDERAPKENWPTLGDYISIKAFELLGP